MQGQQNLGAMII